MFNNGNSGGSMFNNNVGNSLFNNNKGIQENSGNNNEEFL